MGFNNRGKAAGASGGGFNRGRAGSNDSSRPTRRQFRAGGAASAGKRGGSAASAAHSNTSRGSSLQSTASSSARFNDGLNLSFGNFEFRENIISKDGKKGGGVRDLFVQLKKAKREKKRFDNALESEEGAEERRSTLVGRALTRLAGEKVKDDPTRLGRKLAKRRQKKRKSAREWKKRIDAAQESVDKVVEQHGAANKKAMMAANRKRRLAQKVSNTSAGRKDKAKRENRTTRAIKAGKKKTAPAGGKKGGGGGRGGGKGGGRGGGKGGGRGKGKR